MEPAEGIVWFFVKDHQQQGPVGLFELKKLFEQQILTRDSYVWHKDMECWQMAKTVDVLNESIFTDYGQKIPNNLTNDWKETEKDTYPTAQPLVRYLARLFDLSLFSFILITFVSIFSPAFVFHSSAIFIFMLSLVLYILVEAVILSIFGNTLGKSLLNAKVKTVNGEPMDFLIALKRSIFVTAAGMGFGVPIINFICFLFSYTDLKKHGFSSWDKQLGTVVLYGQVSTSRLLFTALFPLALLIAGFMI
ncbi:RDD family protein [Bacillus sp. JJ1764]|uniref:RDD family protein n=1 Tax=Bacillus sp. JJ1764 TaxID=3122964 RepID=UPI002FFE5989